MPQHTRSASSGINPWLSSMIKVIEMIYSTAYPPGREGQYAAITVGMLLLEPSPPVFSVLCTISVRIYFCQNFFIQKSYSKTRDIRGHLHSVCHTDLHTHALQYTHTHSHTAAPSCIRKTCSDLVDTPLPTHKSAHSVHHSVTMVKYISNLKPAHMTFCSSTEVDMMGIQISLTNTVCKVKQGISSIYFTACVNVLFKCKDSCVSVFLLNFSGIGQAHIKTVVDQRK